MHFTEEFLYEATFQNAANLHKHYLAHVLQPGEKFDPNDPKFPYMTEKEYASRAEELSLMRAGDSEDRVSHVVGFEIADGRKVKVHKRSPFYPKERYSEVVMYVDTAGEPAIITYMLGRPGKLYRLKKQFVKELDPSLTTADALQELNKIKKN